MRSHLIILFLLCGIYLSHLYSFLLFHSVIELFSISVSFFIFIIAWNTRRFKTNNYLTYLGIAYFFVGGVDLLHMLSYKGMGIFFDFDAKGRGKK